MSEADREAVLKELLAEAKARQKVSEAQWRLFRDWSGARFAAEGKAVLGGLDLTGLVPPPQGVPRDDVGTTDEEEAA